jgi:hypothetical protein
MFIGRYVDRHQYVVNVLEILPERRFRYAMKGCVGTIAFAGTWRATSEDCITLRQDPLECPSVVDELAPVCCVDRANCLLDQTLRVCVEGPRLIAHHAGAMYRLRREDPK